MDAKLLVVLVTALLSACAANPYVKPLPIPERAFVPGVFIPTDVLKLFNEQAQDVTEENEVNEVKPITEESPIKEDKPIIKETPLKEEKPLKQEKEHNHDVVIEKSSDQVSTVYKPEQQQPQLSYQNTVNQQNAVDQSKLSQNLNPNVQGNFNPQQEYNPNNLPYQQQGAVYAPTPNPQAVNQEPWNNRVPNQYYVQPNYNGQVVAYPPQNVNYQPQNVVNQQPTLYTQQPNLYSQQPNIYNQQPNVYNQQPTPYYQQPGQYQQQPAPYNQQPILYAQQPNGYNSQPVFVPQPAPNQQLFVPTGPTPKLNDKPGKPGPVLNQNQPGLYAMVPINGNQNAIPGNNAYFVPVHQVQPNPALLISSKAEED